VKARNRRKKVDHSGSTFNSFLEQEGIREEVEAVAIKRVLAWPLERAMQEQKKTKQSYGKAASYEPVAVGSAAGPSKCFCGTRYDHAGSQGAWQARNSSLRGRESEASVTDEFVFGEDARDVEGRESQNPHPREPQECGTRPD
jgi:hypothetical protein